VELKFPALYDCADKASNARQATYLRLIKLEYALLITAAILSMNLSSSPTYFAAYALVFFFSIIVLLLRTAKKPEQAWYKSRALAESVKTSTWRYAMRAEPFAHDDAMEVRRKFRDYLKQVLDSNRHIGDAIAGVDAAGKQNTAEMDAIRDLSLLERRDFYLTKRISDQLDWYRNKASWNARRAVFWTNVCVITYAIAIILALSRIVYPQWTILPIEPLIVFASTIIGWMQIKKFNEFSSAYTLTAHEIGLLLGKIEDVRDEEELSIFVNEAELAFSREHTQWVARQHT